MLRVLGSCKRISTTPIFTTAVVNRFYADGQVGRALPRSESSKEDLLYPVLLPLCSVLLDFLEDMLFVGSVNKVPKLLSHTEEQKTLLDT